VTYTYVVTNVGDTALSNVSVVDDKCAPVSFVGGDTDVDLELDLLETWTFTCTTTLTVTTTNTAVAEGCALDDQEQEVCVTDADQATVTVAPPTAPPITNPPITNPPITNPPTTAPTQSLLAATGTPVVTAPPTDSFGDPSRPSTDTWRLLLIALAGLLASFLVLTPAAAPRRR
jgi:hypothetical protein